MPVIGEQDGRQVMAEILDEELAEVALAQPDGLLEDARRAVLALRQVEGGPALISWTVDDLGSWHVM